MFLASCGLVLLKKRQKHFVRGIRCLQRSETCTEHQEVCEWTLNSNGISKQVKTNFSLSFHVLSTSFLSQTSTQKNESDLLRWQSPEE